MTARARGWVGIAAVIAIGLGLSLALTERYHHRILTLVFLWAAMGLAWNIISGYAGQISFGHQAFFGIGAYVTVLLAAKLQLTPWLGMWAGVGVAVLAALSSARRPSGWPASTSAWPRWRIRSSLE
jgi:ABC-type branched-subunit amino acid transport system permease subunit